MEMQKSCRAVQMVMAGIVYVTEGIRLIRRRVPVIRSDHAAVIRRSLDIVYFESMGSLL